MATIPRFSAVCQVGKLEFGGFIAWLAWLALHLYYLVGYRSRIITVIQWFVTFLGRSRGQMAATEQWVFARLALEAISTGDDEDAEQLAAALGASSNSRVALDKAGTKAG
jgi:NADH:ubiquinone reductase (H+-translocating)